MSKKKIKQEDLLIDIVASGSSTNTSLDRVDILKERRSGEIIGKHLLLPKYLVLKVKVHKRQLRDAGIKKTEAEIVAEALESHLKDVQIPKDLRDVF